MKPKISVLIRVRNEAENLRLTLAFLIKNIGIKDYEIIVIDNESTDQTKEIAADYECKIFDLPKNEFTYGRALNFGIDKCTGQYILLLSAHVLMLTNDFGSRINFFFNSYEKIGAIRLTALHNLKTLGEVVSDNDNPMIIHNNLLNDLSKNKFIEIWKNLPIANCSVFRSDLLKSIKFNETIVANEDKLMALEILKSGYNLMYGVDLFYNYFKKRVGKEAIRFDYIQELSYKIINGIEPNELSYLSIVIHSIKSIIRNIYLELHRINFRIKLKRAK